MDARPHALRWAAHRVVLRDADSGRVLWRTRLPERPLADGTSSTVLYATGTIRAIAFSPHGDWLAADLAKVDGWDVMHLRGRGIDRNRTVAAGRDGRLAGWR